jgi:hypothetical protein
LAQRYKHTGGIMTDPLPAPPSARVDQPFDRFHDVPHIDTAPPGTSLFRRRIRLVNVDAGRTIGELEDDCHHFRIDLRHDGNRIERADGTYMRGPWTTCALAGEPLRAVEGRPLAARASAIGDYADARANCTHMFDLTGLAMAQARRAVRERQYDLVVTDWQGPSLQQSATIWRDGETIVHWDLEQREVSGPADWVGAPLRNKFIRWAEDHFDADIAEAAIALRRVIDIAVSRTGDLDRFERAEGMTSSVMMGRCMTYSPQYVPLAIRVKGSARNWEHHAPLMLADMHLRS